MVTEIKRGNKGEMARKRAHKLHKLPFSASACAPTAFFLIKSPFDDSLPFSLGLTEAEAERTHTKCMDMVKRRGRKKIYKRGRNTWCRERQSGRFGNPLSPRLFSKDSSKKKTQRFRFRETV